MLDSSDEVLLAAVLGGNRRAAVKAIRRCRSLPRLSRAPDAELRRIGLTPASIRRLRAALELGRRLASRPLPPGRKVRGSADIAAHFGPRLRDEKRERFYAVLLDSGHRIIRTEEVSVGTLDSAPVVPREALREAVRESAAAVLFVHNHPSGDPTPSLEDVTVTSRLKTTCELLGIRMLDHVIVADGTWTSAGGAPEPAPG